MDRSVLSFLLFFVVNAITLPLRESRRRQIIINYAELNKFSLTTKENTRHLVKGNTREKHFWLPDTIQK